MIYKIKEWPEKEKICTGRMLKQTGQTLKYGLENAWLEMVPIFLKI